MAFGMNNGLIHDSEEDEEKEEEEDSIVQEVDIKSSVHSDMELGGVRQSIVTKEEPAPKEMLADKKFSASNKSGSMKL